jgi:dTDP-4-dehydrorhamnose 3,5-epimerase
MPLNYACIVGRSKLVLYDDREQSPTRHTLMEVFRGPDNDSLVVIPPDLWNAHKGMTRPLRPRRQLRHPPPRPDIDHPPRPFSPDIPYTWDVHHH